MLISADYSQIELRVLAHIGGHPRAEARLRRGARHPRHDGVGDVRRADRGHAGRDAAPRQGDQLRHHLRHLGVRPVAAARHRAERGGRLHQASISSASPASAPTWTRCAPRCARRAMSRRCSGGRSTSRRSIRRSGTCARSSSGRRSMRRYRATAADILRRAMIRMPDALAKAGLSARMLLQVHDELVFEAPEAEVEATHQGRGAGDGARRRACGGVLRAAEGGRPRRPQLGRGALSDHFDIGMLRNVSVTQLAGSGPGRRKSVNNAIYFTSDEAAANSTSV